MVLSRFWKRIQAFISFFEQWLSRNWQAFLLMIAGLYLPLFIFALLAVQIWQLEGGLTWDISILRAIHATAHTHLDRIAAIVTKFGTRWGVIPASIAISLGLLYTRRWRSLTYFAITMLGCDIINRTVKELIHRVRPNLWNYPHHSDFSFPSGHAMSSMMFVAALVILMWETRWRSWVLALGSLFVGTIAWTRLYIGVHYPSDILAGWMMAIAWAVGVSLIVKPHLSKRSTETQAQQEPIEEVSID